MSGRPVQLVEYLCGHATPVRGSGGYTARACPACERGYRELTGRKSIAGLSVAQILGYPPRRRSSCPGEFDYDHVAQCELCASRMP